MAYYKILDYRKKRKKYGFLVFNEELASVLKTEYELSEPDILEAKRSALQHCQKLSEKERALLQARYASPSGEMARVSDETGRSRASLRVTLSRLRAGLRDCISKRLPMEGGIA